ncbi:MAG: site-specific integrase [Tateyamaria sp.]|uniref:tyrosine-type recombinase/integrase n=1 Tax=Tateyamaria sp. TaxID=1929288 RepID=UPI00329C127C
MFRRMARPQHLTENFRLRTRKDGIWEVAWLDLKTRKPKRQSTKTRDRAEAEAKFPQIVADARMIKPPSNLTVGWIIETYLEDMKPDKTPHQHTVLRSQTSRPKEKLGPLRPDQILQPVINDYVVWRRMHNRWETHPTLAPKINKPISDSTIRKELNLLRAAMNHVHGTHGLACEPKFAIKVSDGLPRDEYLTRSEVQKMLDLCEDESRAHIELFLLLSVATGARKEAVLSLKWNQVRIGAVKAGVGQDGEFHEGTHIDFGPGSGNKRRPKIPISNNMRLWTLLTLSERTHPEYVITYKGEPLKDIKGGFANVLREAKIKKKVTPHNMKHTAITLMLQRGIDPETVARWTNTTLEIIFKVYSHHIPDHHEALGDAVGF